MRRKMKLLITSAGSLVGQNILDSLVHKRDRIEVIGMNSDAANPRIFRCDRSYLVPPLDQSGSFEDRFLDIIAKEDPDMILAGRDHDVVFLAEIKQRRPDLKKKIPFGEAGQAAMMQDKYLSFQYALEKGLPFADSFLCCGSRDTGGLQSFLRGHSFPLLAKPRWGFGSLGVRYLLNQEQLDGFIAQAGDTEFLFQEYLGPMQDFEQYARQLRYGVPLFSQIPEKNQFAAQVILSPEGTVSEVFISINTMVSGRAEYSRRIEAPDIEEIVLRYARALYRDGWYGPLNLQLKQDRQSRWKVFEFNPRMTGTTSARYLLGYDEIGILTDFFLTDMKLPNHTRTQKPAGVVFKYLTDEYLSDADIKQMEDDRGWEKS
jgi:carbamoyl-phosphate synthase large subunit